MLVFLMDFAAERYVEKKYNLSHGTSSSDGAAEAQHASANAAIVHSHGHQYMHSGEQDGTLHNHSTEPKSLEDGRNSIDSISLTSKEELAIETAFRQQIAAFLILEFGVIFHSAIIGLTLGTAGPEFKTLYPVVVFHQSFEGLGLGSRLAAIPFPNRLRRMPWILCAIYGLTTPIAIAIGLGLRFTYNSGSFTANIISGVFDSVSAGILLYTGLVELLARDFLFNADRTHDDKQLTFMVCSVLLGVAIMALLGKWA